MYNLHKNKKSRVENLRTISNTRDFFLYRKFDMSNLSFVTVILKITLNVQLATDDQHDNCSS